MLGRSKSKLFRTQSQAGSLCVWERRQSDMNRDSKPNDVAALSCSSHYTDWHLNANLELAVKISGSDWWLHQNFICVSPTKINKRPLLCSLNWGKSVFLCFCSNHSFHHIFKVLLCFLFTFKMHFIKCQAQNKIWDNVHQCLNLVHYDFNLCHDLTQSVLKISKLYFHTMFFTLCNDFT